MTYTKTGTLAIYLFFASALLFFAASAASVSANYWLCLPRNQTFAGNTCASQCCLMCISNSSASTSPTYCNNLPQCDPTCNQKDADQDGYNKTVDCNDFNPFSHPVAVEICDGKDNDCNGVSDDGIYCPCTPLALRSCIIDGCGGIQTCSGLGSWNACVKSNASCNNNTPATCQSCADMLVRLEALESWKTQTQTELTLLQQWKITIQFTISGLQTTINEIKVWLGFSQYADLCTAASVCSQPHVSCSSDAECGTDGYVGAAYCTGSDVYRDYRSYTCQNAGTETSSCSHSDVPTRQEQCSQQCQAGACTSQVIACYADSDCGADIYEGSAYCQGTDVYQAKRIYTCANPATAQSACTNTTQAVMTLDCNSTQVCENAQCITPTKQVVFRTNAVGGLYLGSGNEIVLDSNGDGILECFKYSSYYQNYYANTPTVLARTPEGYSVNKYTAGKAIIKIGKNPIYDPSTGCTTPLFALPTSPYSTNGQEVYK